MTGVVKSLNVCKGLEYLDLSRNNFVGEELSSLDFLYLKFLDQSQNHLTTIVPDAPPIQKTVHHMDTSVISIIFYFILI